MMQIVILLAFVVARAFVELLASPASALGPLPAWSHPGPVRQPPAMVSSWSDPPAPRTALSTPTPTPTRTPTPTAAAAPTPTTPTPTSGAPRTAPGAPRRAFVDLRSGVRLQYVEQGAQDPSRVVIFLHGFTDSSYSFQSLMDRLDPTLQAIALDQRGHGASSRPACCYTPDDLAGDVVGFMNARGIRTATLVGHSMGSLVAQLVAINHPDRISGLVLIGSAATFANPAVEDLRSVVKTLTDPIDRAFVTEFQASTVHTPLPAGQLARYVDESMQVPARVWNETLTHLVALDTTADLRRIRMRTLILWGDREGVVSRDDQTVLVQGIPHATLKIYEEIGHSLHWEAPARVAADLETFMRGDLLTRRLSPR